MFPADSRNFWKKIQILFLQKKSAGLVRKKHEIKRFLEKILKKLWDLFLQTKNEILVSEQPKIWASLQTAETCDIRIRSLFAEKDQNSNIQEA